MPSFPQQFWSTNPKQVELLRAMSPRTTMVGPPGAPCELPPEVQEQQRFVAWLAAGFSLYDLRDVWRLGNTLAIHWPLILGYFRIFCFWQSQLSCLKPIGVSCYNSLVVKHCHFCPYSCCLWFHSQSTSPWLARHLWASKCFKGFKQR